MLVYPPDVGAERVIHQAVVTKTACGRTSYGWKAGRSSALRGTEGGRLAVGFTKPARRLSPSAPFRGRHSVSLLVASNRSRPPPPLVRSVFVVLISDFKYLLPHRSLRGVGGGGERHDDVCLYHGVALAGVTTFDQNEAETTLQAVRSEGGRSRVGMPVILLGSRCRRQRRH